MTDSGFENEKFNTVSIDRETHDDSFDAGIGMLSVSEDTVAMIAMTETEKIPGVIKVTNNVAGELYGIFGTQNSKGIKVEVGNKETIIDIPICVEYGRCIPEVAMHVQVAVAKAINEITELYVKEVNVTVTDIRISHDKEWEYEVEYTGDYDTSRDFGTIRIEESVVAYIAGTVARKIEGVYDLSAGIASEIAGFITNSSRGNAKGVKVQMGTRQVIVDIYINVRFGARIPEVSWSIQEKVKEELESLTLMSVVEVNIIVQAINFDNPVNEDN